jgi:hypothetical protein
MRRHWLVLLIASAVLAAARDMRSRGRSMASLRTICWQPLHETYAIENSDGQWARLSARNLATVTAIAAEMRKYGPPDQPTMALVRDTPVVAVDDPPPQGVYLVSEPDAWVVRSVQSGCAFCVLTDADVLAIDAVHQRTLDLP